MSSSLAMKPPMSLICEEEGRGKGEVLRIGVLSVLSGRRRLCSEGSEGEVYYVGVGELGWSV